MRSAARWRWQCRRSRPAPRRCAWGRGPQVEAIGRRIVEEGGLGQYFLYSGVHSLGVIEFEPPIFGPSSRRC